MKAFLVAAALLALPFATHADTYKGKTAYAEITPEAQVARLGAGINIIGGYDPWWKDGTTKFREKDIEEAAKAGFTHIRVPLFAFDHLTADGKLTPAYLKKIDTIIDLAAAQNLDVVLDVHMFEYCAKNVDSCAEKLAATWYELSEHYRDAPNSVVFELLNEPNGQVDDAIWNAWVPDLISIVRETNPTRNIVVGPTMWNSIDKLSVLQLPTTDRHLIATFHYYSPFPFTHQGASWAPADIMALKDVRWTGKPEEVTAINADFDRVVAWSKANDRPVLLGEYGVYGLVARMEERVAWTKAVSKAADDRGFARAYWYWDGGATSFGVWDQDKRQWVKPIRDALVPKGK
jgi:endoglucanase